MCPRQLLQTAARGQASAQAGTSISSLNRHSTLISAIHNMSAAPAKTLASIAAPAVSQQAEVVEDAPRQNAAEKAAVERGLTETRVDSIRIDGLVSCIPLRLTAS